MSDAERDGASQEQRSGAADDAAIPTGTPTTVEKSPPSKAPLHAAELLRTDAGRVEATTVTMERSGAEQISAERVTMTQSGAKHMDARSAQLDRSGVVSLQAERAVMHDGSAVGIAADEVRLVKSAAFAVIAGEAHLESGARAFLVVGPTTGEGRPLIDGRGAAAFGAAFAVVVLVLRRLVRGVLAARG